MALHKSICFDPTKKHIYPVRRARSPWDGKGRISSPLSDRYCVFLLPLHIKSKNRGKGLKSNPLKSDTGRYYPACHSHPSGLLCVCPACTPPRSRQGLCGTMPHGLSVGGVLFEEPVYEALTCQIPLARTEPPPHIHSPNFCFPRFVPLIPNRN